MSKSALFLKRENQKFFSLFIIVEGELILNSQLLNYAIYTYNTPEM